MGFLCIKIAARFFREYSKLRTETITEFADILQGNFQVFDLLFNDLNNYMTKVKERVAEVVETAEKQKKKLVFDKMSDETYFDMFAHSD